MDIHGNLVVDLGNGQVIKIEVAKNGTVFVENARNVRVTYRYRNGEHGEPEFVSDQSRADHKLEVIICRSPGQVEVQLQDQQHIGSLQCPPLLRYAASRVLGETPVLEVIAFNSTPQEDGAVLHRKELRRGLVEAKGN